jgi:hypothetical protein
MQASDCYSKYQPINIHSLRFMIFYILNNYNHGKRIVHILMLWAKNHKFHNKKSARVNFLLFNHGNHATKSVLAYIKISDLTAFAASLMNCFADSLQIAGTVSTHVISFFSIPKDKTLYSLFITCDFNRIYIYNNARIYLGKVHMIYSFLISDHWHYWNCPFI